MPRLVARRLRRIIHFIMTIHEPGRIAGETVSMPRYLRRIYGCITYQPRIIVVDEVSTLSRDNYLFFIEFS